MRFYAKAVIIRQELCADHRATEELAFEAFWNLYEPGAKEPFIIHRVRTDVSFIPELNLVAESDGKLVGHVMCSRGKIVSDDGTEHEILTFGPLCVSPTLQRGGIGAALIEEVARIATNMGFRALVLLDDWDYYSKRGFVPGEQFDIHLDGWYLDALQVRELYPGALTGISGQCFDALLPLLDCEAQAAFDATFPLRGLPTEEDKARYAADATKYETACRPARPETTPNTETPTP